MKRVLAMLLSAVVLLSALPLSAAAAARTVTISSVEELQTLAEHCVLDTWSTGKTVVLACDLDLSGIDFSPIPLFGGNFDGQGHTIKGLSLTSPGSTYGLFRQILSTGVIKSLNVAGSVTPDGTVEKIGGIAGINWGKIESCSFSGTVSGFRAVGGITGCNQTGGIISNCTASGVLTGQHRAGGIVGENNGTVKGSTSAVDLNTTYQAIQQADTLELMLSEEELLDITDLGGIAGLSTGSLQNCINTGAVGYPHAGYNVGGIVGRQSGYVLDCTNQGTVTGRKDVGGIAGQMEPDAAWNISVDDLENLQGQLNRLRTNLDQTFQDASFSQSTIRSDIQSLLDTLNTAGDAAERLTFQAEDWFNANADTLNELSNRITSALDDFAPVGDDLADFTAALSDTLIQFEQIAALLQDTLDTAQPGFDDLRRALTGLQQALQAGQTAAGNMRSAIENLRSAAGDPIAARDALAQVVSGLSALSNAVKALAKALGDISAELPPPTAGDNDVTTLIQQLLELWSEIGKNLGDLSDEFGTISSALEQIAHAAGNLLGQFSASALEQALADIQDALIQIQQLTDGMITMVRNLRSSIPHFSAAGEYLSEALELTVSASDTLSRAFESLTGAVRRGSEIIRDLGSLPSLHFTPIDETQTATQQELFDSLETMNGAVSALSRDLTDNALLHDIQLVSDQLIAVCSDVIDILYTREDDTADVGKYAEDISATENTGRTRGTVVSCVNHADVSADTNAGGIAGAVALDISFDQEDTLDLSAILVGGAKYIIYAAVRECENYANISAAKSAAGGIAGRMDYGAALDCVSSGAIQSVGEYAGGIVGYSLGTIRRCYSRANLSGESYVGGIAGLGHDLYDCRTIPYLEEQTAYQGAIAGSADGVVSGNYYAESTIGGVDGFSFSGQTDPVSYDKLVAMDGSPDLFRSITVTFLADGEVIAKQEVPFGSAVEELPAVPGKDDMYWQWDDFDRSAIYHSMTITGEYRRPVTTISTGEAEPLFLAEGKFYEGQSLFATPFTPELSGTALADEEVLAAYTLQIRGYADNFTARMLTGESGQLYTIVEDGQFQQLDYRRDGSYIVFAMENGGSLIYVRRTDSPLPQILTGAAIAGAAAILAACLIRKNKRKPAATVSPR